jgi:hypothetical protein
MLRLPTFALERDEARQCAAVGVGTSQVSAAAARTETGPFDNDYDVSIQTDSLTLDANTAYHGICQNQKQGVGLNGTAPDGQFVLPVESAPRREYLLMQSVPLMVALAPLAPFTARP